MFGIPAFAAETGPITGEQDAGWPRDYRECSLKNRDMGTAQAFQMTDGRPRMGCRPVGSGQQFRAWAGTKDAHPSLAAASIWQGKC